MSRMPLSAWLTMLEKTSSRWRRASVAAFSEVMSCTMPMARQASVVVPFHFGALVSHFSVPPIRPAVFDMEHAGLAGCARPARPADGRRRQRTGRTGVA